MKTKIIFLGLIVALGYVVAGVLRNRESASAVVSIAPPPQKPVEKLAQFQSIAVMPQEPTSSPEAFRLARKEPMQGRTNNESQQTPVNQPTGQLQDPDARVALAFVGEDLEAESYWLDAIFDTSLPDNEREDLMEDLNEVGFDNPKQLGVGDLPLILNRLAIIDRVAPYADDFMTPHLAEAYKDLVDMANKAINQ